MRTRRSSSAMRRTTRPSIRVSGAVLVAILFVSWQQCLAFFTLRGRVPSPRARCLRRAEDQDTMGELFTKYYRLQEVSSKASTNTCNLWACHPQTQVFMPKG
ncbi:unnamed protein product [Durusdinium trenchii]|uniref:Uncharacterized protein n=1 Tax=Durusdinium trenchii TaxID=1381693 RepID=A0ABP0I3Z3_9DINO